MSIIIEGMDLPVTCAFCIFGRRFDNVSSYCELKPNLPRVKDTEERPQDCPLKSIPTKS